MYYVYILTNYAKTVLYVGVTNDIERRVAEHKSGKIPGFTQKYKVKYLVYYAEFDSINDAIAQEKALKGWTRAKKVALITEFNPKWEDLAAGL